MSSLLSSWQISGRIRRHGNPPGNVATIAQGEDDGAGAVTICSSPAAAPLTVSLLMLGLHEPIALILEDAVGHLPAFRARSLLGVRDITRHLIRRPVWVLHTNKRRDQLYAEAVDPPPVIDHVFFYPRLTSRCLQLLGFVTAAVSPSGAGLMFESLLK